MATNIYQPPTDPALATLKQEAQNVATPNMTAAGPTVQQGALTTDPNLPSGFQKDATGRIFKSPVLADLNSTSIAKPPTSTLPGSSATTSGIYSPPNVPNIADTSAIDAQIKDQMSKYRTPEQIDADLQGELGGIESKYVDRLSQLNSELDDRAAQEFSDLAGVGIGINPLSSAGRSVSSVQNIRRDKFISTENALKAAEQSAARARAQGLKTDGIDRQIAFLEKQKADTVKEADDQYQRLRQHWSDTISGLNAAASAAKEDRMLHSDEMDKAKENITDMFDLAGSKAFDGVSDDAISNLEKSAGWQLGTIAAAKNKLKTEEQADAAKEAKGDLREVGGNLYQVVFDANGNASTKLIQSKGASGGGGGGFTRSKVGEDGQETPLSLAEFVKQSAEEAGLLYTPNPDRPEIQAAYKEYLDQFKNSSKISVPNSTLTKNLTSTDRKKMIAMNLDVGNPDDIRAFYENSYSPKKDPLEELLGETTP